jgi:hypothetical protein
VSCIVVGVGTTAFIYAFLSQINNPRSASEVAFLGGVYCTVRSQIGCCTSGATGGAILATPGKVGKGGSPYLSICKPIKITHAHDNRIMQGKRVYMISGLKGARLVNSFSFLVGFLIWRFQAPFRGRSNPCCHRRLLVIKTVPLVLHSHSAAPPTNCCTARVASFKTTPHTLRSYLYI